MGKFKNAGYLGSSVSRGNRIKSSVVDISKFNADIKSLVYELKTWSKNLQLDSKKILKPAGEVVARQIQKKTPVSRRRHYRYGSGGAGRVATYFPGNLRRSIQDLNLIRTGAIFIGPKFGNSQGTFSGARVDGWYAQIVDRGAPAVGRPPNFKGKFKFTKEERYTKKGGIKPSRFIQRGVAASRRRVFKIVNRRLIERINQLKKK
jgi:hypothetical protein